MKRASFALLLLVLLGVGGSAMATIPGGDGYIHACYLHRANSPLPKGNLRVIDTENGAHCGTKESELYWSGYGVFASDRNAKTGFREVDPKDILAAVGKLPVSMWTYKSEDTRHIGPMAQDFRRLFGIGTNDKSIAAVDTSGVSLAAIKGLDGMVRTQQREIAGLALALLVALIALGVFVVRGRVRSAG
jgi:hypothetical protein